MKISSNGKCRFQRCLGRQLTARGFALAIGMTSLLFLGAKCQTVQNPDRIAAALKGAKIDNAIDDTQKKLAQIDNQIDQAEAGVVTGGIDALLGDANQHTRGDMIGKLKGGGQKASGVAEAGGAAANLKDLKKQKKDLQKKLDKLNKKKDEVEAGVDGHSHVDAARDTARYATKQAAKDAARDASTQVAKDASQDAAKDAAKDKGKDTAKDSSQSHAKDAAKSSGHGHTH